MLIPLILVLLPSAWLVVAMLIVAACRAASSADARPSSPNRSVARVCG